MPTTQQRAESQLHPMERHSAPLKEFAAKLEWFLRDQERRERRNCLVLAMAGPALGLLGVFFSKPIAARISGADLALGLTPEELNRFVPWLSSVLIMVSVLPWLNSPNPSHRLHLPKSLKYGEVVRWYKRKGKFVEMSRGIAEKLAIRSLLVLLLFGVGKVLRSEGLLLKRIPQLWSKPILKASSGYPEAYFSDPQEALPAKSADASTNTGLLQAKTKVPAASEISDGQGLVQYFDPGRLEQNQPRNTRTPRKDWRTRRTALPCYVLRVVAGANVKTLKRSTEIGDAEESSRKGDDFDGPDRA